MSALKEWMTRNPVGQMDDDQLGSLILNDGGAEGCWVARTAPHGQPIIFEIGGRFEPDPTLIARARDILQSFDQFSGDVAAFLASEARRAEWAPFATEILALRIQSIGLYWPRRPEDGMVFFDGSNPDLCWRCDLTGRRPVGLGFDS